MRAGGRAARLTAAWPAAARLAAAGLAALAITLPLAPASAASPGALPGPPGRVTATALPGGALLSWRPPAGATQVTGYLITAAPGGATARTSDVTAFLAGGLRDGTSYTFTVAAVSAAGTGPAGPASAAVTPRRAAPPAAPRAVTATAGYRRIRLTWQAPPAPPGAPAVTGYAITATPGAGAPRKRATAPADARSITLNGLRDGLPYRVSVAAVNGAGTGARGAAGSVTPRRTPPGKPTDLTAAPVAGGIRLTWQPPASGSPVTSYEITAGGKARTAGPAARSAVVTGLPGRASFTARIRAVSAAGAGQAATAPAATSGATRAPGSVVLGRAALAALAGAARTDGSLVFTSPPRRVRDLQPGDVLTGGVSPATPAGLLATVTGVTATGSQVTVATRPAALSKALVAAGLGASLRLPAGQVAAFIPARPGIAPLPASAGQGAGLRLDTVLYRAADGAGAAVTGTVRLTPALALDAAVSCCIDTATRLSASVTAAVSLRLASGVSHGIGGSYPLGTFRYKPVTLDAGGVPVVLTPELSVALVTSGAVTPGLAEAASARMTVGASAVTRDLSVTARPVLSASSGYRTPSVGGTVSAAAGVRAVLSVAVNGTSLAAMTGTMWPARLAASVTRAPWWVLSAREQAALTLNRPLLESVLPPWHAAPGSRQRRLAGATGPFQGITITPDPGVTRPGGRLALRAAVAGAASQAVTWSTPPGDGSITAAGDYTAPDAPGSYEVTAARPATGLWPGGTGLTAVQAGPQPPSPPRDITAVPGADGGAAVRWSPPGGGAPVTGYVIAAYRLPGATAPVTTTAGPGATSVVLAGLAPGADYAVTVSAAGAGGRSQPAAAAAPVTAGDAPSGGTAWTALPAPVPPDGNQLDSTLAAVACPPGGPCTAAGSYTDGQFNIQGMLVTGSGSAWTATRAPLPAGGAADPAAALAAIACPAASRCAAAGGYGAADGGQDALLDTGSGTGKGTAWRAVTVPLPAGAASGGAASAGLTALACPSPAACTAAGFYSTTSGSQRGLLVTGSIAGSVTGTGTGTGTGAGAGSGAAWRAVAAPLPPGASATAPQVSLNAVACPSAASCVAAGQYTDGAGHGQPLLVTGSGTAWHAVAVPLPAGHAADPAAELTAVACAPGGSCTAAGSYTDSRGGQQGLLVTGSGGTWRAATAPLPTGAGSSPDVLLTAVACPPGGQCVVAGSYQDRGNAEQGVTISGSGSGTSTAWTARELTRPANTLVNPQDVITSLACPARCAVAGGYLDSTLNQFDDDNGEGLLATRPAAGAPWTAAQAPLPADANPAILGQYAQLAAVAGWSGGYLAVGSYIDSDVDDQALIVTGRGG